MADKKLSQLSTSASTANLWLPGFDLTRSVGDQDVKVPAALLVGGAIPVVSTTLNGITVAVGGFTDTLILTPNAPDSDIMMLALEIKGATIAAPTYNFQIYTGNPASGGVLIFDYNASVKGTANIGDDGTEDYIYPGVLYLPGAAAPSNQIWLRVISTYSNRFTVYARMVTLEFEGHGPVLPGYVTPAPYTGPLLASVHVGPTQQFTEPRYAMQALADGGTMIIDPGTYYLPFGVTSDPGYSTHPNFGPNPSSPSGAARFVTGITIQGAGTYNATPTIFDGRGGNGLASNPNNPTPRNGPNRMTIGKAFCYTNSPILVQDVLFRHCGGDDEYADGEAGVYAENFPTPGVCHLLRCAFDQNENGIASGYWHGGGAGENSYATGTGNSRNVTITIENCDFGYLNPNGGSGDGHAHDFYVDCLTVNVINSHFYNALSSLPWRAYNTLPGYQYPAGPTSAGNNMKSRTLNFNVTGSWVRAQAGKLIDRPEGGTCVVKNSTFLALEPSTSLTMGYNTEGSHPSTPMSDAVFTGCSFYFARENGGGNIWWNNTASNVFDLTDPGNTLHFSDAGAHWSTTRTGASSYGWTPGVVTGVTAQYQTDSWGAAAATGATYTAPPPAPPPASLAAGVTAAVSPLNP